MDAQLASGSRCCEARLANPAPMARISHRQPRVRGVCVQSETLEDYACPSAVKLPVMSLSSRIFSMHRHGNFVISYHNQQ
ncbi:hypothetical protein CEP53_012128 [Fusarium sp. AF-6]|nr:hypothetical protein CEP53_012128 [Fusarium sp. AF-6]